MNDSRTKPGDWLPYTTPQPDDPAARRWVRAARIGAYVLLAVALIYPVVQFQVNTMENYHDGQEYAAKVAAGELRPGERPPKSHKGAIGRWRKAVRQLWQGKNIYRRPAPADSALGDDGEGVEDLTGQALLHPNMPFTVILMTPFAYLPVWAMALAWNLLKLAVLAATILMAASVFRHNGKRLPDWILGLALLWGVLLIVGDIQHGNTNVFVLGAITLHLWLYRRGRDIAAGAALALAICLKMTPALFVLYWLYQRNWKLLLATAGAGLLMVVVIPAVALGPSHYVELTDTWLDNLIIPGLVKGSWYPIHINQSLSGVVSRYTMDGQYGNIMWNPDDDPNYTTRARGWINVVALTSAQAKWLLRAGQVLIVALMAWAIGWRKLPRDDGRRGLHYGLVVIGILLLNQRTWDHHAGILLLADVAVWYAIAFGHVSRRARAWALWLMIAAGPLVWLMGNSGFKFIGKLTGHAKEKATEFTTLGTHVVLSKATRLPDVWADLIDAYGPTFLHFVLLLTAAVILCVSIRRNAPDDPYDDVRQKLGQRLATRTHA